MDLQVGSCRPTYPTVVISLPAAQRTPEAVGLVSCQSVRVRGAAAVPVLAATTACVVDGLHSDR